MDVYQVTLLCAHCHTDNKVVFSSFTKDSACSNCGFRIMKSKRFAGVVYVLSHPEVGGVKIGMTEGDVFARARKISGTGVPGQFVVTAAFPSSNPRRDERKVHQKLKSSHKAKEHFALPPVEAVMKVRSILGREPAYIDPGIASEFTRLREERRLRALNNFSKGLVSDLELEEPETQATIPEQAPAESLP